MSTWCSSAVNRAWLSLRAASRTRSSPLYTPGQALCPGRVALAAFPLASPLSSTTSAVGSAGTCGRHTSTRFSFRPPPSILQPAVGTSRCVHSDRVELATRDECIEVIGKAPGHGTATHREAQLHVHVEGGTGEVGRPDDGARPVGDRAFGVEGGRQPVGVEWSLGERPGVEGGQPIQSGEGELRVEFQSAFG